MKTYVTFGQDHVHVLEESETGFRFLFDKDCVAVIESENRNEGRNKAFDIFGPQFSFEYFEGEFEKDNMTWYPRGFVEVPARFNILT